MWFMHYKNLFRCFPRSIGFVSSLEAFVYVEIYELFFHITENWFEFFIIGKLNVVKYSQLVCSRIFEVQNVKNSQFKSATTSFCDDIF